MWGTFDVDNYGDHLFPLVAAAELGRRLPGVELRFASPYGRLHPTRFDGDLVVDALPPWSADAFATVVDELDCVLVGGGEILHGNDRLLAAVYGTRQEELARLRPSGWFLEAAALAGPQAPFVMHAVGVTHAEDGRVAELARAATVAAVRDRHSAARLRAAGVTRSDLSVVPDTAFLVDRLFDDGALDAALARLRDGAHVPPSGRPLVVQGCDLLVPHVGAIAAALVALQDDREVVVVETGRGRGDDRFADTLVTALDRDVWRMPAWAGVLEIAAVIRASDAFLGSSLHGCITAAAFGRPFVTLDLAREPKLAGLGSVTGRPECVASSAAEIPRALDRAHRRAATLPDDVVALQREVDRHFDRVAGVATASSSRRRSGRTAGARRRPAAAEPHPAAVRMHGSRVVVVVVDHDGGADTIACLARLHELTWRPSTIVLVDNGSTAPMTDEAGERWPDVEVIRLAENTGFAAGCNEAIRSLVARPHIDHIALVNNDAVPDVGFLEPLVGALDSDPTLGAAVPKVLLRDRHARIDLQSDAASPGPWDRRRLGVAVVAVEADGVDVTTRCLFARGGWGPEGGGDSTFQWTDGDARLWVPVESEDPDIKLVLDSGPTATTATLSTAVDRISVIVDGHTRVAVPRGVAEDVVNGRGIAFAADGSAFDVGYLDADNDTSTSTPSSIAAWSGATVVLRADYLRDVGPLRDDLFLYYEDVDHSLRGARRGWRFAYVPTSVVRHAHGATSSRTPDLVRHLSARNRLLVLAEHAPLRVVAHALVDELRAVGRSVRYDVVAARRAGRSPSWRHVRAEILVLGGFAQRLPRSLRGRLDRRR